MLQRDEEKQKTKLMVTTVERMVDRKVGLGLRDRDKHINVNLRLQALKSSLKLEEKISAINSGKTRDFNRECPDWKREEKLIFLMSFDEDQRGQGLFFYGSYQDPLINLEVEPNQEEIAFSVDSGVAHYIPTGTQLSDSKLLVSGVKEKGFNTSMFKKTEVKYK
jgi:hypothetical protein